MLDFIKYQIFFFFFFIISSFKIISGKKANPLVTVFESRRKKWEEKETLSAGSEILIK